MSEPSVQLFNGTAEVISITYFRWISDTHSRSLHALNHRWVHFWPLVHTTGTRRRQENQCLERLTLDRAFHSRITAEPLPGANFPANRDRTQIPSPGLDRCGEYYVAHVCLQRLQRSN